MKREKVKKCKPELFRLAPSVKAKLEEVSADTGWNKTQIAEFAILRLACEFKDLAAQAVKSLEVVLAQNMHNLPAAVVEEIEAMKKPKQPNQPNSEQEAGSMVEAAQQFASQQHNKPKPGKRSGTHRKT